MSVHLSEYILQYSTHKDPSVKTHWPFKAPFSPHHTAIKGSTKQVPHYFLKWIPL